MISRNVLIVGAAHGIGKYSLHLLAKAGFTPYVIDRDESAVSHLTDAAESFAIDLQDRVAVHSLVKNFRLRGLRFHAVVITAGVHSTHPIEFLPDEVIDNVIAVNFAAHAKFVRDIVPLVEAQGRIVGVSSIGATVGLPMSSVYSASKAALEVFYESLATEMRRSSIFAVIIQPGNVNTGFNETGNNFTSGGDEETKQDYQNIIAKIDSSLGMSPNKVARAILKAVTVRSPRLCYVVGINALKAYLARRILGRHITVALLRRHFDID